MQSRSKDDLPGRCARGTQALVVAETPTMRIVSGQYRGKAIATPPGDTTRPTSDRARQAVFNIL